MPGDGQVTTSLTGVTSGAVLFPPAASVQGYGGEPGNRKAPMLQLEVAPWTEWSQKIYRWRNLV